MTDREQTFAERVATIRQALECCECPVELTRPDAALAALDELVARDERLKADQLALSRWARQQNAGNAFATQVRLSADARVMEWDLPVAEWEP